MSDGHSILTADTLGNGSFEIKSIQTRPCVIHLNKSLGPLLTSPRNDGEMCTDWMGWRNFDVTHRANDPVHQITTHVSIHRFILMYLDLACSTARGFRYKARPHPDQLPCQKYLFLHITHTYLPCCLPCCLPVNLPLYQPLSRQSRSASHSSSASRPYP